MAIKMKNYAGGVNIVNNNNIEKRILHLMFYFIGILSLIYVLFLASMIFNIVERKSLEANARILSNEVGNLELQYLSASNKVDLSLAYSLGFKETKAKFATRKNLGSLKVATNEI